MKRKLHPHARACAICAGGAVLLNGTLAILRALEVPAFPAFAYFNIVPTSVFALVPLCLFPGVLSRYRRPGHLAVDVHQRPRGRDVVVCALALLAVAAAVVVMAIWVDENWLPLRRLVEDAYPSLGA